MNPNKIIERSLLIPVICLVPLALITFSYFGSNQLDLTPGLYYALCILFVFIIFSTYQLEVVVFSDRIQIKFGIGLIRFNKKIEQLVEVKNEEISVLYGIGIRWTPKGMLYNINANSVLSIKYLYQGKERQFMIGAEKREELKQMVHATFK